MMLRQEIESYQVEGDPLTKLGDAPLDQAEQQMQPGDASGQAEMQVRDRAEQLMQPGNALDQTDARGRAEQLDKTHTITQSPRQTKLNNFNGRRES